MQPLSIMALFCEDIREEKREIVTLVGILPDSVNVSIPSKSDPRRADPPLLKLAMYVRINFDPDLDLGTPKIRLVMPNGEKVELGTIKSEVVSVAREKAKEHGNPLAGVISRATMTPFRVPKGGGVMRLEVLINDVEHMAGALNFLIAEKGESSTSSSA